MTLLLVPLLLIMRPMPQMQTVPLDAAAE